MIRFELIFNLKGVIEMNEEIKIVQFVQGDQDSSDYCLDDKGNVYKIEYNKRNELTLIKQKINVIIPS